MPYTSVEAKRAAWNRWYQKNKAKHSAAVRKHGKKRTAERKAWIAEIKLAAGCSKCGYKEYACALDFHHLDPKEKDINPALLAYRGWSMENIKKELDKCIVLCANCHRVVHRPV